MPRVLRSVELAAERAADVPGRPGVMRFPAGQAAEDGQLVRAARGGDRDAFDRLYARYARMVHGLLLARTGPADVDDLVQDVFLAAWRRLDDLRDPAAFGGWVATIARRHAADLWRSRRAERAREGAAWGLGAPTSDRAGVRGGAPGGDDVVAAGDSSALAEANAALRAIATLPDAYRETLVLRLVEGFTGPEIAERTGLTAASVRVNLHRGLKLLREKLNA